VPLAGLGVTSDLSGVIDDATYNDDEAFTSPPIGALGLDLDGNVVWTGSLDPGQSVTFTYSVTVRAADDLGDGTLEGELAGTQDPDGPGGPIAPGDGPNLPDGCPSAAGCTSSIPVVAYTVAKVASPGAVNTLTGKVTYVITVENTGAVALAGPTAFEVVDDLSGVLDDAVYNDDAVATAGTASYVAPTLTWTGPLAVDATAVLTYSVDVNVFASLTGGDQVLENVVTTNGAACLAPAPVPADPGCSTLTPYRPFGRPGGGGGGGTTGGGGGGTTGGPGGSTGGPGAPAPAAGSPTGGDGSGITTAGAAGATGHLPTTGSDLSTTMQLALGLVLLGGGIVVLGRWRLRLHVGGP
jgi:LPXTG-motif cell wall-anchored protein